MRPATIVGILLILLGIVGLALGGFSFTQREEVLDVGPIEATAEEEESVPIPPALAVVALVGGIALVALTARRT